MTHFLTPMLALMRKDLRLYFSNRRALIMSIAAPILIAAFFGYLFGDNGSKVSRIGVAVSDLDHSELSKKIIASLSGDGALEITELPEDEALARVKAGKLTAALTLPAGFDSAAGRALFNPDSRPEIVLHYDPSQAMALQVVRGLLAQYTMTNIGSAVISGSGRVLKDARSDVVGSSELPTERRTDLLAMFDSIQRVQNPAASAPEAAEPAASAASANGGFQMPYSLREQQASSRPEVKYNSFAHSFAGMGVQFILLAGIDLGIGLLLMRRMDLWKRLRAAPISKALLLGSRIASTAVTALVLLAIIYAAAMAFFGVRIEGSVAGFIGVAVAFALLTASFGLLIAAIGRTPEATRGLAIFVTLLLVMLGGAWVPAFVFPEWLQRVSLFVPTRWAVDGLDAMTWRGLGFEAALAPIGVMLGFALVFALVALARFDWEE